MFKRWEANRTYKKVLKARDRDYSTNKEHLKSQEEFDRWYGGWDMEISIARIPYDRVRTSYWTQRAIGKLVELPARTEEEEGHWERSQITGEWVLTDKGVSSIRTAIRQETLAGTEMFFRVGLIVVATIIALSGIGSILVALSK